MDLAIDTDKVDSLVGNCNALVGSADTARNDSLALDVKHGIGGAEPCAEHADLHTGSHDLDRSDGGTICQIISLICARS